MRWVTILAAGYALSQMLAYTDPARHSGSRRSGAVAAARDAHGRADPGRPHTAFVWGRPVRPHARNLAKIGPRRRPPHEKTSVRRPQSRLNRPSGRDHPTMPPRFAMRR